jgi:hypothetical protein
MAKRKPKTPIRAAIKAVEEAAARRLRTPSRKAAESAAGDDEKEVPDEEKHDASTMVAAMAAAGDDEKEDAPSAAGEEEEKTIVMTTTQLRDMVEDMMTRGAEEAAKAHRARLSKEVTAEATRLAQLAAPLLPTRGAPADEEKRPRGALERMPGRMHEWSG